MSTTAKPEAGLGFSGGDPSGDRPALSEVHTVALAVGAWLGALSGPRLGPPLPLAAAALAVGLALVVRSRSGLVVATVVLAAAAGQRADHGYRAVEPGPHEGLVTAVADPRSFGTGWRVEVALASGERVEARAYGTAAARLATASAGDRLDLVGRLSPMPASPWARARHLVGRLAVSDVGAVVPPGGVRGAAEAVRDAVAAGAERLPPERRALYLGLVIGDDRDQSLAQRARFRAGGLTHLLAVSGQNVAFVLTVARPLVRLAPRRGRFLVVVALLGLFATVTRFEPSVLRATVTAGLGAWAVTGGHPQSAIRLLALAVTGLLVVDPFLVHSVGFQLSVSASAGIVVLAPLITARLPSPPVLSEAVAVTIAAQLGVLPLLLAYFGPVSLASVPANLAAGWAAGAVMMWGLTMGVVAGTLPPGAGVWLQAPANTLVWWLDGVAAWSARLPLPLIGPPAAAVTSALLLARWLVGRRRSPAAPASPDGGCRSIVPGSSSGSVVDRARRILGAGLVVGLVALGAGVVPRPPSATTALPSGAVWIPAGSGRPSVLIVPSDAGEDVLDELLAHRIRSVDIVIAESGHGRSAKIVRAVAGLSTVGLILAPPQHRVVGATRVRSQLIIPTAGPTVVLRPAPRALSVSIDG